MNRVIEERYSHVEERKGKKEHRRKKKERETARRKSKQYYKLSKFKNYIGYYNKEIKGFKFYKRLIQARTVTVAVKGNNQHGGLLCKISYGS